jgi:hypothetical protein
MIASLVAYDFRELHKKLELKIVKYVSGCSKFEGLKACGKILWLDSKTNLFIYLDNLFF